MPPAPPAILCVGACLWDVIGRADDPAPRGADLPGRVRREPGGVALNLALHLTVAGLRPAILTAVGRDGPGDALLAAVAARGVIAAFVHRDGGLATDSYVAVEDGSGLVAAVVDARCLEGAGFAVLAPLLDGRLGSEAAPWAGSVVVDGNLPAPVLHALATHPALARARLLVAPASPDKAARLAPLLAHPHATIYANRAEAESIGDPAPDASESARRLVWLGARRALVTDGPGPVADADGTAVLTALPRPVPLVRVTGAGDAFMAAHVAAEAQGATRAEALRQALDSAALHVRGEA